MWSKGKLIGHDDKEGHDPVPSFFWSSPLIILLCKAYVISVHLLLYRNEEVELLALHNWGRCINNNDIHWLWFLNSGKGPMEIDIPSESNKEKEVKKENGFNLFPVSINASGEGLPYAPVDWPNPGDKWLWKVGKRISIKGFFMDRYLYPPSCLRIPLRTRNGFASKLSVQEYIQKTYPDADVDAFFASFSWKIPAKDNCVLKGCEQNSKPVIVSPEETSEQSEPDSQADGEVCKANNKLCSSLLEPKNCSLQPMACDLCCSEPGFCLHCCCILCNKHISDAYGGYSFIKCMATMGDGTICGHLAHIDCALRCYMAGTVGGTIGLDAEYYCRRCDSITDFISHVTKLLRACKSIKSLEDIEKVLNVGSRVLRGSQKTSAKNLLDRIALAMAKLNDGACLVDMWKEEDISLVTPGRLPKYLIDEMETDNYQESIAFGTGSPQVLPGNFDLRRVSLTLEDEIDQILHALRNAQKNEFRVADNALHAQKNNILDLYRQLEHERLELHAKKSSESSEILPVAVREREDQIKREVKKLRVMKHVAKGFGMTSKDVLEEHFEFKIDQ